MARIHGAKGRIMTNLTSGGTAEPIAYTKQQSLNAAVDFAEATAFGDLNKVYVAGLPDSQGAIDFWYDDATVQTYTAATDGVARKMYFYPEFVKTPGQYFWGTVLWDFAIEQGIDGVVAGKASWRAASNILKVG